MWICPSSGGKRKPAAGFTRGNKKKGAKRRNTGPHLNSKHKRELGINDDMNPQSSDSDSDGAKNFYDYEYKGSVAEEDMAKNRRYDPVDNLEYELPEDFEVLFIRMLLHFFRVWLTDLLFGRMKICRRMTMIMMILTMKTRKVTGGATQGCSKP